MRNPLNIINIDGVDGVGKTTQIDLLYKLFSENQKKILKITLEDTIESASECADKTDQFLTENPGGMVIADGSIAKMIVSDYVGGLTKESILSKYGNVLHRFACLSQKYETANLLLINKNIQNSIANIEKREKVTANKNIKVDKDLIREREVVRAMFNFNDNAITKNIKFVAIEIDNDDYILDIQDKIWDYLTKNFDVKKPLFNQTD